MVIRLFCQYASDFDGLMPPNQIDGNGHTSLAKRQTQTWTNASNKHLGNTAPIGTGYLSYYPNTEFEGLTWIYPHDLESRQAFYCPGSFQDSRTASPSVLLSTYANDDKYWL